MTTLTLADEMEAVVAKLRNSQIVANERQKEVIREYCKLSAQVAEGAFRYEQAADCFCSDRASLGLGSYIYDDAVLNFIREAVHEKMQREGHRIPEVK